MISEIKLKSFNLLVSTSRYNEGNTKAELWFTLLALGDELPLIFKLGFSGLIGCITNIEPKKCIKKMRKLAQKNPDFFQYILKITPIEFNCETDLKIIRKIIHDNFHQKIKKQETFKLRVNKRNFEISKLEIVDFIADGIDNKVDLKNPDKIVNIEILGKLTGISFLNKDDIFSIAKEKEIINRW